MTLFDPEPAAPLGPLVRVRLDVAYDGSRFHGFAPSPGVRTVASVLSHTIGQIVGHAVEISGAGRTDRGVHAAGQVVAFDVAVGRLDLERLRASLNAMLRPEIAVVGARLVAADFDPRRHASRRTYRYTVLNRLVHDPLRASTSWHVPEPLDLAAMRLACDPLLGEHDFSALCRRPKLPAGVAYSMVRTVTAASWTPVGDDVLCFEISANAFCHQMVRSIVGLHVAVGRGRRRAGEVAALMRAQSRRAMPELAPPQGLVLWRVAYGPEDDAQAVIEAS